MGRAARKMLKRCSGPGLACCLKDVQHMLIHFYFVSLCIEQCHFEVIYTVHTYNQDDQASCNHGNNCYLGDHLPIFTFSLSLQIISSCTQIKARGWPSLWCLPTIFVILNASCSMFFVTYVTMMLWKSEPSVRFPAAPAVVANFDFGKRLNVKRLA